MLGIDHKAVCVAWSVFLFALVLGLVYLMRRTLLVFVLAILFAYLLAPVVDYCQRFLRRLLQRPSARVLSLAVVYILLVGILILAGVLIGGRVSEQVADLAKQSPDAQHAQDYTERLKNKLENAHWLEIFEPLRKYLVQELTTKSRDIAGMARPFLEKIGAGALSAASNLIYVVLVPILGFFFLKDGSDLKRMWVDELISADSRPMVENILADVHSLLGHFMRALVLLSLATFTAYSIFLTIVGVRYPLVLALTAALFEFIPVIGTAAAAILIALVAGFTGGPILAVVIFLAAYRLFQDYVLSPHLMSHGVELHPLAVIFGVLAGEQVAGVPGMFLSIPAMAILRVVYLRMRRARIAATQPLETA